MTANSIQGFSRRLYGGLLQMYPRDFYDEYGTAMMQLFTDQCRSAVREGGARGVFSLWQRSLIDLLAGLFREHLSSPRGTSGLLEAVPGKPLPWKGVLLVLIPGIVFLVGQIGQLAGEDWFFLLIRRAAYYLIIPVLAVWIVKKRLPLWGLIPLAMIYRTLIDAAYRVEFILESSLNKVYVSPASWIADIYKKYPPILNIMTETRHFLRTRTDDIKIVLVAALTVSILLLVVRIARRSRFPRAAGIWLGAFILFALMEILSGLVTYLTDYQWTIAQLLDSGSLQTALKDMLYTGYYYATLDLGFLLPILAGALTARRHGRLALLLPLGYLIPAVLLGRFDYDPRMPYFLIGASAAVLIYRIFVTLLAPVWILRSGSERAQTRAGAVGLLTAVAFITAVEIVYMVVVGAVMEWEIKWTYVYYTVSPELIMLAGFGLALSLYRPPDWGRPKGGLEPSRRPADPQIGFAFVPGFISPGISF